MHKLCRDGLFRELEVDIDDTVPIDGMPILRCGLKSHCLDCVDRLLVESVTEPTGDTHHLNGTSRSNVNFDVNSTLKM